MKITKNIQILNTMITLNELDFVFISYDEPLKEEFYDKNLSTIAKLKRVDEVKGIDTAHKTAAKLSDTEWFVVIDGDNIVDTSILSAVIDQNTEYKCFRYRSRNSVNGVISGNGGVSCWSKDFVLAMTTHENNNGSNLVEFGNKCRPTHGTHSTTYINQTPYQAWRAGFREGIKLCLTDGMKQSLNDFNIPIQQNKKNLTLWHNVGRDVPNGFWSIYGSRLGTYMLMFTDFDLEKINDYDFLKNLWEKDIHLAEKHCIELGLILKQELKLDIIQQ